jgi:hypothetical protein
MPLAFIAIFVGAIVVYMGLHNESFSGLLSDEKSPISTDQSENAASSATDGSSSSGSTIPGLPNLGTPSGSNTKGYINPLSNVTHWERTDQGVDATMPTGAAIKAPGDVKIIGVIPNWYAGQPLVWWQLLTGPDKGQYQYVAEQIDNIAPVGSLVKQGQAIAQYAASGTGIEYGWSTGSGQTLARGGVNQGTGGRTGIYDEGYATVAGNNMRKWLNSLGANAGTGVGLSIGAGPDLDDLAAALKAQTQAWEHRVTIPGYTIPGIG